MTPEETKDLLEGDLWSFAQFVLPHYLFGDIHRDVFRGMGDLNRAENSPNQLYLLPRDHLKSVCIAVYTAWLVARNPACTVLYITSSEDLGRMQLAFIQNIFDSDRFRAVWPDHFIPEQGRREKWTSLALNTDHPKRKELAIRDETIAVKTVKSDKTGRHPDYIMYDDLVVPNNAYTEIGRQEVARDAAQAVSLAKTGALMTAVGTVYHPRDQYALWQDAEYPVYTNDGEYVETRPLWRVMLRRVEDAGDGSGTYLWPRSFCTKTRNWYGWDRATLAKKKAEYLASGERVQFSAQYYLEANDPESARLSYDQFQYLNPGLLTHKGGEHFYAGRPLSIICTMDVATTDAASRTARKADYTALAVVGLCPKGFYYLLELQQFQTDKRDVYFDQVIRLWKRWNFRKVEIEMENAGKLVAESMKEQARERGYPLIIGGKPAARGIAKHERHASITLPRYEAGSVYHQKGGWTNELEDQLVQERPAHDDLLDVVTMAIEILKPPASARWGDWGDNEESNVIVANTRFGGRR